MDRKLAKFLSYCTVQSVLVTSCPREKTVREGKTYGMYSSGPLRDWLGLRGQTGKPYIRSKQFVRGQKKELTSKRNGSSVDEGCQTYESNGLDDE